MLRLVVDKTETIQCQNLMAENLQRHLSGTKDYILGFPSGNVECELSFDNKLWFTSFEIDEEDTSPRYWNSFGLTDDLNERKSNNIVVEINIPTNGLNRRVSGLFAKDDKKNEIYLLHRGRIGGGRKGIGKSAFVNWLATPFTDVVNDDEIEKAILIGCISKKTFPKKLFGFVQSIKHFKAFATSGDATEASFLSFEELEEIAGCQQDNKPKKITIETTSYTRNSYISELAKRKASGICQLCLNSAPFNNKYGQPYLAAIPAN